MLDNNDKPLDTVPEVWLRKRKQVDKQNIQNKRQQKEQQRQQKKSLRTEFTRIDTLLKRRKEVTQEASRLRSLQRHAAKKGLKDNEEGKLLLVVRSDTVKNKRNMHKSVQELLKELRLTKVHSAVFLRNTPELNVKLNQVRPYIFMGTPSLETVRGLINKRAHTVVTTKTNKTKTVPVSDNAMVEEALGDEGVICVEDIIHEIINGDKNTFDKVAAYLAPFELNTEARNDKKKMANKLAEQSEGERPRVHKTIDSFVDYYN